VDNLVLSGTSMPHVLWKLQGYQKAVFVDEPVEGQEGVSRRVFQKFELVSEGTMSEKEYDGFVRDTANFLEYIAEPERSTRRKVGTWVIIYLLFFLILSVMLKKQIWKDVS
jgi:ubiquinol-cytochrome c reductase cytochrome c1 subunit